VDKTFDGSLDSVARQVDRAASSTGEAAAAARDTLRTMLEGMAASIAPGDSERAGRIAAYAVARADVAIAQARAATTPAPAAPTGAWQGSRDADLQQTAARLRAVAAEAAAQAAEPSSPVVVVQEATQPTRPVFPIIPLNTIVAGLTGLALGCYYALFCGLLERVKLDRIKRGMERPMLAATDIGMLRNIRERRS
jgi:uncharacterized protein involved in exopolysaccharide biosynthesis